VAHEIEIKLPELANKELLLPVIDHLTEKSSELSVVPTGDGWQNIYTALETEWEQQTLGQTVDEAQDVLITDMTITYKDRSRRQRFETKIRLEFTPSKHMIRRRHGQRDDWAERLEPLQISHTSFVRLS
jgi:hypothetical protein